MQVNMQILILSLLLVGYGLDWWETATFYTGFRWSLVVLTSVVALLLLTILKGY